MAGTRTDNHSPRFFRNSLIAILVLAACLASALCARRSLLHLLWIVPLLYLGSLVLQTHRRVHPRLRGPRRHNRAAAPAPGYELLELGSDGLLLTGWHKPGHNRAAVILIHPFGLSAVSMVAHASPLAEAGYALLLLDLRAHGTSQGDVSTPGWREAGDVLAAVEFLKAQRAIDPGRIGVLGISFGAQAALRAAARSTDIGAVVAEGPGPAGLSDASPGASWPTGRLGTLVRRFNYFLVALMSGERPAPGLMDLIGEIAPRPVLLISAGQGSERAWLRALARRAAEPKELWELPEAGHGGGLVAYPRLYGQKIVSFFDKAFPEGQE